LKLTKSKKGRTLLQYVIDTNYLINNLNDIVNLDGDIVLLSNVFEEVDKLKNRDIQDKKQLRE
jgi:predicted ribonuclease YlaK